MQPSLLRPSHQAAVQHDRLLRSSLRPLPSRQHRATPPFARGPRYRCGSPPSAGDAHASKPAGFVDQYRPRSASRGGYRGRDAGHATACNQHVALGVPRFVYRWHGDPPSMLPACAGSTKERTDKSVRPTGRRAISRAGARESSSIRARRVWEPNSERPRLRTTATPASPPGPRRCSRRNTRHAPRALRRHRRATLACRRSGRRSRRQGRWPCRARRMPG